MQLRSHARRRSQWLLGTHVAFALALALLTPFAHSQYPTKPVRIVVGFPSGTGPDFVARVIAQKLQETFTRGVMVDNKAGAAGIIAAQEVARVAPDGYTLLLGEVGQLSIAPSTY